MAKETYRITSPVLGLSLEGEVHASHTVPKGAIVALTGKTFDDNKLVEVVWGGKVIMMFAQDLRSRGEKIKTA